MDEVDCVASDSALVYCHKDPPPDSGEDTFFSAMGQIAKA